jgi:serine/threonine protein kinase
VSAHGKDSLRSSIPCWHIQVSVETSGLTFGRYVLVERIAAGGMGEVFVALQTGIGRFTRPIAVKLLLPHLADDERVVSMFLDEARVGAQMSHANIAQVYDVGQDHQRYFIAMELVRGVSLSGLIAGLKAQNHEQLSADVLAHIGRSLAEGLHVAHEQKAPGGKALELIHRDVTPHNILVSVDGAVKLTDFGIAHVADADRQSRPGMVMGKLGYLAPEQILGQPLDRRVDLFAAGATLYHLAALERPFDTPTGAVLDPQRLPATPLRVCRPDLPRQLVDAIERAMENSLERRFHNARELRNALPVPSPDAAEALGAVVRRVCKVSIDELEAKTDRATRAFSTSSSRRR